MDGHQAIRTPAEVALADLQDAPVEPRAVDVDVGQRLAVERARRPGRASGAPPSARRPKASAISGGHVDGAVLGGEARARACRRGSRGATKTRSKCAWRRPRRPPGRGSARRSRAPARAWRRAARCRRRRSAPSEQRVPRRHRRVGQRQRLARTSPRAARSRRCGCPATWTSSRRRRCPGRIGIVSTACSGCAVGALHVAAEQQVEGLVGAAELDVGLDRDRVVALHQRIEQLEHRDRRRARRSAWRSRRARAAARRSSCARGGRAPPSACPATRS